MKNIKRRTLISAIFAGGVALSGIGAALANTSGDAFQPIWVDSLKTKAQGTKGQTAHREIRISAGPDRVFKPGSWKFVENARSGGGRVQAHFRTDQFKYRPVTLGIEGGGKYTVDWPSEIVIVLHAETGSGTGNYNRGAWLNGYVHAETFEIDK